jgi:hypothetical protein
LQIRDKDGKKEEEEEKYVGFPRQGGDLIAPGKNPFKNNPF